MNLYRRPRIQKVMAMMMMMMTIHESRIKRLHLQDRNTLPVTWSLPMPDTGASRPRHTDTVDAPPFLHPEGSSNRA
jgi:hypothetical protein